MKSDFHGLYSVFTKGITPINEKKVNLNHGIKEAIFYGHLAFFFNDNEISKGKFATTSLYILIIEMMIGLKANNGMFSSLGSEFKEYQTLMNILDVSGISLFSG